MKHALMDATGMKDAVAEAPPTTVQRAKLASVNGNGNAGDSNQEPVEPVPNRQKPDADAAAGHDDAKVNPESATGQIQAGC